MMGAVSSFPQRLNQLVELVCTRLQFALHRPIADGKRGGFASRLAWAVALRHNTDSMTGFRIIRL